MPQKFYSLVRCLLLTAMASAANGQGLCESVAGARLLAQDDQNTFLGTISRPSDPESIFNAVGIYGSPESQLSIWNRYGRFGSEFSAYSPHNAVAVTPPRLVREGRLVGYLSKNPAISAITPDLLRERCRRSLARPAD